MVQTRFIIILLHNHFGVFSPDSYQGKAVEEPGQEKKPENPSGCRQQGISGIQDLMVLQNKQLPVKKNLFHLVKKQTESPGGYNPKSIPPSTWG